LLRGTLAQHSAASTRGTVQHSTALYGTVRQSDTVPQVT
jgi:hypothetical protein